MFESLAVVLLALLSWAQACRQRHSTRLTEFKEARYERARTLRAQNIEKMRGSQQWTEFTTKSPHIWYFTEPLYSCEHTERFGDIVGDGAKLVCNPHHIKMQPRCLYYGFGVDGEVYFDEAWTAWLDGHACDMHAFDPVDGVTQGSMPKHLRNMNISFHPWGLNDADGEFDIGWSRHEGYTLDTIKRRLGHVGRTIDILKMDIEGSEWQVFNSILAQCDRNRPVAHQILVELHSPHFSKLLALVDQMDACGYRIFATTLNYYCMHCVEVSWVHENFIKCAE